MLSVLQQIGKAPISQAPQSATVAEPQSSVVSPPVDVYKLFQTKNTQDIGTSAPVQEVQQFVSPQPVSILDQLAPKGAQKVVPSILEQLKGGTVGSATVATAKEAPAVSVSDLFGGQLRVGN